VRLAPHESLELHEVLRTEALEATKTQAMMPMAEDRELKSLMEQCAKRQRERIQRLTEFAR
jgi:similar to spore coat protein